MTGTSSLVTLNHLYCQKIGSVVTPAGVMEAELTEQELIRFCKESRAPYKAPRIIIFLEDFPKTPQGKILKRGLKKYRP
jgi:acyl-coenzyme A synthetase/AMP-(fatty) acid ligase